MIPYNAHSVIHNYGIAGMDSYLLGAAEDRQRLLHMTRNQVDFVTPHSHKSDLTCEVLRGSVKNILFNQADEFSNKSDMFAVANLMYNGVVGQYDKINFYIAAPYEMKAELYTEGDTYFMSYDQIHSIFFTKNAIVRITEGPTVTTASQILQPVSDGTIVKNFHVHEGLFLNN